MKLLKDRKLHSLRNEFSSAQHSTITNANVQDKNIVVTIPEDLELTEAETSVLSKGLPFVPVNKRIDEYQVKADCEKYFRCLRLKAYFHGAADNNLTANAAPAGTDPFAKFDAKVSKWTPPDGQFSAVDHYIDRCRRFVNTLDFKRSLTRRYDNLSDAEKKALCDLRRRTDVVIKPADKGGAVVVWSRPLYIQEGQKQLSDQRFYEKLTADPLQEYQHKVKTTVTEMISTCALPPSAKNLVVTTPRTSRFYLLPKIHKPNNPGRPIVSACSCPTENISANLDEVLAPFVKSLPT